MDLDIEHYKKMAYNSTNKTKKIRERVATIAQSIDPTSRAYRDLIRVAQDESPEMPESEFKVMTKRYLGTTGYNNLLLYMGNK